MNDVHLWKLEATGNDFLVTSSRVAFGRDVIRKICDRHRGVGADGLILLGSEPGDADCTMSLWNADGTTAEMSGNGIRCLAWLANHEGRGDGKRLVVATAAGRRGIDLELDRHGEVVAATVAMGPASVVERDVAMRVDGTTYVGDVVDMGNPHFVVLVDPASAPVTTHGPLLEHDARFPAGTNVEFVRVNATDELEMRVWERGVGETLSCGTGACAAAASARRRALVGEHVSVHVSGGVLDVHLGEQVHLGGPVRPVFDLELDVDEFVRLGW